MSTIFVYVGRLKRYKPGLHKIIYSRQTITDTPLEPWEWHCYIVSELSIISGTDTYRDVKKIDDANWRVDKSVVRGTPRANTVRIEIIDRLKLIVVRTLRTRRDLWKYFATCRVIVRINHEQLPFYSREDKHLTPFSHSTNFFFSRANTV